ncbi:MAG: hypothetical protein U0W40_19810 [Acidimicrobiia bacterium]
MRNDLLGQGCTSSRSRSARATQIEITTREVKPVDLMNFLAQLAAPCAAS